MERKEKIDEVFQTLEDIIILRDSFTHNLYEFGDIDQSQGDFHQAKLAARANHRDTFDIMQQKIRELGSLLRESKTK